MNEFTLLGSKSVAGNIDAAEVLHKARGDTEIVREVVRLVLRLQSYHPVYT